jgi:hypothetical protein
MQSIAQPLHGGALRSGWRRSFYAMRADPHAGSAAARIANHPAPEVDPITLTIMAVNRLGSAQLRTAFHGVAVTVAAPDAATAAIFRAALSQMAKERRTDQLISVELIADTKEGESVPAEPFRR